MNSFSFINNFACYPWHASLVQTNSTVTPEYTRQILIEISPLDLQHMNTNKSQV